jgi:hypothetical protein
MRFLLILAIILCFGINALAQIAYVPDGVEIRAIAPDGTNDRRLWTHPDAKKPLGIDSLAWSPDGKELAFSSRHTAAASLYDADIFVIHADGSGLRKVTNAPQMSDFARFPKGTVSVTFRNDQPIYKQSQASAGVFIVYLAGAAEPQQITLPPGATKTVVFNQVADFGNTAQPVVAIWGNYRWFVPGVDVRAGASVKAPVFSITGDGIEYFGAYRPVWRQDGSRISYRSGTCTLNSVPINPTPVSMFTILSSAANIRWARVFGIGDQRPPQRINFFTPRMRPVIQASTGLLRAANIPARNSRSTSTSNTSYSSTCAGFQTLQAFSSQTKL